MDGGLPIYHVDRVVREAGKNPSDMHYKILADRTRYFKEDEKGVAAMCKIMEELIDSDKRESALRLLKLGKLSNEEIANGLGLTVEVVNALEDESKVAIV